MIGDISTGIWMLGDLVEASDVSRTEIIHTIHHSYHVPSPPQYVHVHVPGPTVVKPVWDLSTTLLLWTAMFHILLCRLRFEVVVHDKVPYPVREPAQAMKLVRQRMVSIQCSAREELCRWSMSRSHTQCTSRAQALCWLVYCTANVVCDSVFILQSIPFISFTEWCTFGSPSLLSQVQRNVFPILNWYWFLMSVCKCAFNPAAEITMWKCRCLLLPMWWRTTTLSGTPLLIRTMRLGMLARNSDAKFKRLPSPCLLDPYVWDISQDCNNGFDHWHSLWSHSKSLDRTSLESCYGE